MATSSSPLSVQNLALSVAIAAISGGGSSAIDIDYSLDQVQGIFAAFNTEAAPGDAIWASALAPDQADGSLTQDGSEGNPFSLRRAIYSATPGKHVLLKDDGTYTQTDVIQTRGQYSEDNYVQPSPNIIPWNMVQPTSASERIVIRGEPGTCPVFDATGLGTAFDIGMDFLSFRYLRIDNGENVFNVASTAPYGSTCQGFELDAICGQFNRQTGGIANVAFVSLNAGSATGGVKPVLNRLFIVGDSSSANRNNACVYITQLNKWALTNSYLYGVQEQVVYFKHGNDYVSAGGLETVDITMENNYCSGNVSWAGSGATIQNNIITGDLIVIADGGGSEFMQDYNLIDHNTVLGDITLSVLDHNSNNNTVTNNVMSALKIQIQGGALSEATNTNSSDYNLINAVDDGNRFTWATSPKTLAAWQTDLGLDLNSNVAANQLEGLGSYSVFSDFELIAGSVGLSGSDTGGAVGANVATVGVRDVQTPAAEGSGYVAFDAPVIIQDTAGVSMSVPLIRRQGTTGSLTVSLSASDGFRAQGVQSYAGGSVTFLEGETTKIVAVPLNSVSLDGEAHFTLSISGNPISYPNIRYHEATTLVIVDDGSIYSAGVVLSDPSTEIIQDNIADNSIIYLRSTGGAWDDASATGYTELSGNDGVKGLSLHERSNVVIRNYPGETPVIQASNGSGTRGSGCFVRSCTNVVIRGLEVTTVGDTAEVIPVYIKPLSAGTIDQRHYIIDCHVHDWYGGDNTGGVRLDDCIEVCVFNSKIHHGYDIRKSSNTLDAVPYGLHAGVHGYGNRRCTVYQNTIHNVARCLYRKDPNTVGEFAPLFARNFCYDFEGAMADYDYAGAQSTIDSGVAVFENIAVGSTGGDLVYLNAQASLSDTASNNAEIYNNLRVGGGGIVGCVYWENVKLWNNLVSGGATSTIVFSIDGVYDGEVNYCDYNGYELDYRWLVGRNGTLRSYDTLSAWQASDESGSADNQVVANPDTNAGSGAPVFTDAANDDYTLTGTNTQYLSAGRFADNIGAYRLGSEQIGATI